MKQFFYKLQKIRKDSIRDNLFGAFFIRCQLINSKRENTDTPSRNRVTPILWPYYLVTIAYKN